MLQIYHKRNLFSRKEPGKKVVSFDWRFIFDGMEYLKFEKGYVLKKWRKRIPMALVFPNKYALGMSNLGFLFLYQRLNLYEEIVCERFFYEEEKPLLSLETKRPLKDFPIILFCLPFEGDYLHILKALNVSGIPLEPTQRAQTVLAGGIAISANPTPLFPFLDGFFLGEWEGMEDWVVPLFIELSENKEKLLTSLENFPFFLSPSSPKKEILLSKVKEGFDPVSSQIISEKAQFKRTYLVEVFRGCGRGCRFCLVGFLLRPPRAPAKEALIDTLKSFPEEAKVGLIGLEFAEENILPEIWSILWGKRATLTFSSLRVERITEDFINLLHGTRSIALAPETASARLKRIINKPIESEQIIRILELLAKTTLKKVKFYFMYGLPTEKEEDLRETVTFIKELLKKKYPFEFSFSFSPFVPKPHTPFQWEVLESYEVWQDRENFLKKELRGVRGIKFEPLRAARLQAFLARGDEETGLILGQHLFSSLTKLLKELEGSRKDFPPSLTEKLPWDFIKGGVKKEFLLAERKKAFSEKITKPCQVGKCKACSACGFLSVESD